MEVEILEDSSELLKVLVSLPRRKLAKDKHISVSKWQIIEELKNQNLTFNKCLEGPEQMNNWGRDNMLLEAEFVFSKKEKQRKLLLLLPLEPLSEETEGQVVLSQQAKTSPYQEPQKKISFSELKIWTECAFKHKLAYIDGLKHFSGNEYTAFGTAVHYVCETLVV